MAEVKRDPITSTDANGNDLVTFDADHSWADVARWAMQNRTDAEELHRILTAMLAGNYSEVIQ